MKTEKNNQSIIKTVFAAIVTIALTLVHARAELPKHNIAAANLNVVQNDTGNTAASVTVTTTTSVNDFRVRSGSNRGDYNVQIGSSGLDDITNGVIITSITQNGRDNGEGSGTNFVIPTIDFTPTNYTGSNLYFIPVFNLDAASGASTEYNINVAGAFFPYTNYIGALVRNINGTNGGFAAGNTNNQILGTAGLAFGQNFTGTAAGKFTLNLASFGVDSRTDGVLLVCGGKNEGNYGLSQVNTNNGTWNLFLKDKDANAATTEEDPIAFVFIPKTNTAVVSGRFLGNGSIDVYSGNSPQFTVSSNSVGVYELKIPGFSATNGVLIISAEGGRTNNQDNFVSYQLNDAGDGWIIQSRDQPLPGNLESPLATEPVVSFAYIPGPTPGVSVTPTNNLLTSENLTTAQFNVVLHTQPSDNVTIGVSSSDLTEGTVSTSSLVFTPADWNVPQTVIITGVDDGLTDGAVAYTIILDPIVSNDANYNGINPDDVSVVNADNEGGITVAPTSGLTTTEAGAAAIFNVHLNTQPTGDVTIPLSSSDATEGTVSPTSVTFTSGNWNVDQPITVTGVDDFVDDGNIAYTIITGSSTSSDTAYNGLNAADVSLSNTDNDTAGFNVSASVGSGLAVIEGKTTNYTVVLESEPTANVVVHVSSSNTSQGGTVSSATLTFTSLNWSNAQTVTVTAADDTIVDGSTAYTIDHTITSSDSLYAALAAIPVAMTTLDNEGQLTLPSGDLIYGIGLGNIGIDGRASIVDTNSPNYAGGTLSVTLTANGTSDDRVGIRNTGTGVDQIGVSGNAVSYGGTQIGTFTGGVGTAPLVITLNSAATPTATEALLRSVTFGNINNNPSLNHRSVSVVITDGDGGVSSASTGIRVGLLRATSFQQGADYGYGIYSNAVDMELRQALANTAFPGGSGNRLFVNYPDNNNAIQGLLRFDNIVGNGPGQVPANAVVVSAELFFDISDSGDASPLYRMLIDWNTNNTYSTFGNSGVNQNDVQSASTYDSQFGLENGDASTSVGLISFGVTPDVAAWVNGANNYGWVMPAWLGNLDGTGISSSTSPNISVRPRLHVLWLPAGTASASFRQGVNGYASAHDTRARQNEPTTDAAAATGVFVDWQVVTTNPHNEDQALLRFDDIIGSNAGQIPAGSQVHAAILDLAAIIGQAMGDGGNFYPMLQPWQDTDTWDSLINGISADGNEAAALSTASAGNATLNPNVQAGFLPFELTTDVQAWVNGVRPNYGWAVLPWTTGGDGWGFGTSEQTTERNRPQLRVYYTPGAAGIVIQSITRNSTTVTIKFSGEIGTNYSVRRAGTVAGTYGVIGSAQVQIDGTATFVDNAPLSSAAFYRISNP